MIVNSGLLKQKIGQYINKEISKNELGLWSMRAYYCLLKGEYIEIDKLSIYHFLRTVSTFHTIPNDIADEYPCSEDEVMEIYDILCGRKSMAFTFNIRVFQNFYSNKNDSAREKIFCRLKEIFSEISSCGVPQSVIKELTEYVNQTEGEIHTIVDLLECHIKSIIVENLNFEEDILYKRQVGIYVGKEEANGVYFAVHLKKLLDCVLGNTAFRVSVIYRNGVPNLAIVL